MAAGDDAIPFRKHTLDLGISETVAVVDMNGDGRLDIISGENWYEQGPPLAGVGPPLHQTQIPRIALHLRLSGKFDRSGHGR